MPGQFLGDLLASVEVSRCLGWLQTGQEAWEEYFPLEAVRQGLVQPHPDGPKFFSVFSDDLAACIACAKYARGAKESVGKRFGYCISDEEEYSVNTQCLCVSSRKLLSFLIHAIYVKSNSGAIEGLWKKDLKLNISPDQKMVFFFNSIPASESATDLCLSLLKSEMNDESNRWHVVLASKVPIVSRYAGFFDDVEKGTPPSKATVDDLLSMQNICSHKVPRKSRWDVKEALEPPVRKNEDECEIVAIVQETDEHVQPMAPLGVGMLKKQNLKIDELERFSFEPDNHRHQVMENVVIDVKDSDDEQCERKQLKFRIESDHKASPSYAREERRDSEHSHLPARACTKPQKSRQVKGSFEDDESHQSSIGDNEDYLEIPSAFEMFDLKYPEGTMSPFSFPEFGVSQPESADGFKRSSRLFVSGTDEYQYRGTFATLREPCKDRNQAIVDTVIRVHENRMSPSGDILVIVPSSDVSQIAASLISYATNVAEEIKVSSSNRKQELVLRHLDVHVLIEMLPVGDKLRIFNPAAIFAKGSGGFPRRVIVGAASYIDRLLIPLPNVHIIIDSTVADTVLPHPSLPMGCLFNLTTTISLTHLIIRSSSLFDSKAVHSPMEDIGLLETVEPGRLARGHWRPAYLILSTERDLFANCPDMSVVASNVSPDLGMILAVLLLMWLDTVKKPFDFINVPLWTHLQATGDLAFFFECVRRSGSSSDPSSLELDRTMAATYLHWLIECNYDPYLARLMSVAPRFQCEQEAAIVSAMLSFCPNPFFSRQAVLAAIESTLTTIGKFISQWQLLCFMSFAVKEGDVFSHFNIFQQWQFLSKEDSQWASRHMVDNKKMRKIETIVSKFSEAQLRQHTSEKINSTSLLTTCEGDTSKLRNAICASFFPNLVQRGKDYGGLPSFHYVHEIPLRAISNTASAITTDDLTLFCAKGSVYSTLCDPPEFLVFARAVADCTLPDKMVEGSSLRLSQLQQIMETDVTSWPITMTGCTKVEIGDLHDLAPHVFVEMKPPT